MQTLYEWKVLENGLLLEPRKLGPYYDEFNINSGRMDTREEAIARLEVYQQLSGSYISDFVLVELWSQ
jgi:hypothetical protein